MADPKLTGDRCTLTVRVPISIRRRDGPKLVLAPDGTIDTFGAAQPAEDDAMVKAIARAFRWREMLEDGTYATIREIAAAEKVNESYVGRVLRLTPLAPWIVEADCQWHAITGGYASNPDAAVPAGLERAGVSQLTRRSSNVHVQVTCSSPGAASARSDLGRRHPGPARELNGGRSFTSGTTVACRVPTRPGESGWTPRPAHERTV
jgi:hypothetical protein